MFGAFYFGQPYFGQASPELTIYAPVAFDVPKTARTYHQPQLVELADGPPPVPGFSDIVSEAAQARDLEDASQRNDELSERFDFSPSGRRNPALSTQTYEP